MNGVGETVAKFSEDLPYPPASARFHAFTYLGSVCLFGPFGLATGPALFLAPMVPGVLAWGQPGIVSECFNLLRVGVSALPQPRDS